jgi:excisionase family DNA binding protein
METDKYFRYSEAAEYLGITLEAVRQAVNKGRLTVTIDHGVRWLSKDEVMAYRERTDRKGNRGKGRPPGSKDKKPRRARGDREVKPDEERLLNVIPIGGDDDRGRAQGVRSIYGKAAGSFRPVPA